MKVPEYNRELDFEVSAEEFVVDDSNKIVVSCMQYNEGEKKLQINRMNKKKDGEWSHRKLGRLKKAEAIAVANLLNEMKESL